MRRPIAIAGLAFVAATAATGAPARAASAPLVRATLHAATARPAPGRPFVVAVALAIAPGYHVYWTNPGQTGLRTEVAFRAPPGWTVGPARFPGPRVFVDAGGIESYGYDGEVVVSATVTPPTTPPGATAATLGATVDYVACKADECVPGKVDASLELAPGAAGRTADQARIAAHEARLPRPLASLAGASSRWTAGAEGPTLTIELPAGAVARYFPSAAETPRLRRSSAATAAKGRLAIAYRPGPRLAAAGVLEVVRGGATTYHQLDLSQGAPP